MGDAEDGGPADFPETFDPVYFMKAPWIERVAEWRRRAASDAFSAGNEKIVAQLLSDRDAGLRAVVNITNAAAVSFMHDRRYKNLYERPMIGGTARVPSTTRTLVDTKLGLGRTTYFAAVALGGAGVRYYGEYCMVLVRNSTLDRAALFDRNSYDIIEPPLSELDLTDEQIGRLAGTWTVDLEPMVAMKVLPELSHSRRLATTGTISEAILRDQEFIEVHLSATFTPDDLDEVRESPDEIAVEARIGDKMSKRRHVSAVEYEWTRRRDRVAELLHDDEIRVRVVTTHGRGYQWA